jgi:hypothetical protein
MPELPGVVSDVVPARDVHVPDLRQDVFAIDRTETLLLVSVRHDRQTYLRFEDCDLRVAQPDFVARIRLGVEADSGRIRQVPWKVPAIR